MYKKLSIISSLVCILFTLSLLTSGAYFSTQLTTKANPIKSANFKVNSDGTLDDTQKFEIEKFAPGELKTYNFCIDKSGTEVPVNYKITFTKSGDLFSGNTPVKLSLLRYNDSSAPEVLLENGNSFTIYPQHEKENYALQINWPWGSSSEEENGYAGKLGSVAINVLASQIKENDIDPDNLNEHITTARVIIEDENKLVHTSNGPLIAYRTIPSNQTVSYNDKENTIKILNNNYLGDIVLYLKDMRLECTRNVGFFDNQCKRISYTGLNGWILKHGINNNSISMTQRFKDGKNLTIMIFFNDNYKWDIKQ